MIYSEHVPGNLKVFLIV